MNQFTVEIVSNKKQFEEVKDEWLIFFNRVKSHTLYQAPEYLAPLLQSLSAEKSAYFLILTREYTDRPRQVVAIAPFVIQQDKFAVKFGIFSLFKIQTKRALLLGNDILVAPGEEYNSIVGSVLSTIREAGVNLIYFDCLCQETQILHILSTGNMYNFSDYQFIEKDVQPLRGISFRNGFDDYLSEMSKKTRYNLKRSVNQFEKKTGSPARMVVCREAGQVPEFFRNLDTVFRQSWQAAAFGYQQRNTYSALEQHKSLAKSGIFRSYTLYKDDEPIAFIRGYQYERVYYFEEIGFVKAERDLEPGTVLNFLAIKDMFSHDKPDFLNFGYGENDYKRKLGNFETQASEALLVVSGSVVYWFVKVQSLLSVVYSLLRKLVIRLGVDHLIRKLIKRR